MAPSQVESATGCSSCEGTGIRIDCFVKEGLAVCPCHCGRHPIALPFLNELSIAIGAIALVVVLLKGVS